MQNRYTGDAGDFFKYALLRALAGQRRLGVAWYLYPDEDHNTDGRHVTYLNKPELWADKDPELFDRLAVIVRDNRRNIAAVQEAGLFPGGSFAGEPLDFASQSYVARAEWRSNWFDRVLTTVADCELVFADPDNGLREDNLYRSGRNKDWKSIPLSEVHALADGRTAVIYHHNTRRKGGHREELRYWVEVLGSPAVALKYSAFGSRTFFVVNPTPDDVSRLEALAERWGPKAQLVA